MDRDLANLRKLAAALRVNLVKCAAVPGEDPVHDTRTGTRRLQATLESLLREMPSAGAGLPQRGSIEATLRLLKKLRRAAAPVRDLDVHRKLLDKLVRRALGEPKKKNSEAAEPRYPHLPDQPDALETPAAGLRTTSIEQQADDLDAWLKHRRSQQAAALQEKLSGAPARLDRRMADLAAALKSHPPRLRKTPVALVALDSFARLAIEMHHLHAGNLHDFRKGTKKARYVAELASQQDAQARSIAQTLKKLQDEIGDWHDWLVLAEEARAALGDQAAELIGLIDAERERHFVVAMKSAVKLRGRLMGEWLALSAPPRRRPGSVRPESGARRASA